MRRTSIKHETPFLARRRIAYHWQCVWFQQCFLIFPFIGNERSHQTLVFRQQQCMPRRSLQRALVQRDNNPVRPSIDPNSLPETLQRFLGTFERT